MKRPWAAAAGTAIFTSLLFSVVYNLCNHLTAIRPDVGVWAFGWEQYWPMIAAFIIPYWSIDALFFLAPFVCTSAGELAVYRRRIVFTILGGGLCFLLIPLKFGYPRPHVTGTFQPWFQTLYGFDLPHNLFPSLHIALRTLLTSIYLRKGGRITRWLVHGWFCAIGVSTIFTWQHHLVDVLGGFWLAAIAIQFYPFDESTPARGVNLRVAAYYGAGALVLSQLARLSWPWTFPLVWPAFALGAASYAYCGLGGSLYRKEQGDLTLLTRVLFAPLLFGQWLSLLYYRRKSDRWNALTPNVWIGALPTEEDAREAIAKGVTAVLDLTVEFAEVPCFCSLRYYYHLPVLDLTAPTQSQLEEAARIIEREAARGIIFVHCKAGYSRTAAAVGAWLLRTEQSAKLTEVIELLQTKRPGIIIRPEVRSGLQLLMESQGAERSALDPQFL